MKTKLKPFSIANLKPINKKKASASVDASVRLDTDQILVRAYEKHEQKRLERGGKATQLLQRLPNAGEVFTLLLGGNFDGWAFVESALTLAAPETIAELYVATLGFGEANAGQLLHQLDSGKIGKVWFCASCYMRDGKHGDKFARLSEMLKKRGHHIAATRNHAKLIAVRFTNGSTLCVDGSINLCACSNTEQAHVWNDEALFTFYSNYIRTQAEGSERVK